MTQAESKSSHEPTMEDILSSIRRIISEDYPAQAATGQPELPQSAPARPAMPQASTDILDLKSRGERFLPPKPGGVQAPLPQQAQPRMPQAHLPNLQTNLQIGQSRVAPVAPHVQPAPLPVEPVAAAASAPHGVAARAVSEFSERLGRSFAAVERYQRDVQAKKPVPDAAAPQVSGREPITQSAVQAVAAAVQSHLAEAQAAQTTQIGNAALQTQHVPEPARSLLSQSRPDIARRQGEPLMQNDSPPAWLVSPKNGSSVSGAFKAPQEKQAPQAPTLTEAQSAALVELMSAALRPMLKDWLDQNLPGMVERMITAEIQRVTHGE